MSARNGAFGTQVYEGAFASTALFQNGQTRFPSALAGPGGFVAPAGGTIQGRFGWGNVPAGTVSNTRVAAGDQLGLVLPLRARSGAGVVGWGWSWEFFDPAVNAFRIRAGLMVTLMAAGDFWLRFVGGAYAGEPVYASLIDGAAISGQTSNAELTPWVVCSNAGPGNLAQVSTYAKFGD